MLQFNKKTFTRYSVVSTNFVYIYKSPTSSPSPQKTWRKKSKTKTNTPASLYLAN